MTDTTTIFLVTTTARAYDASGIVDVDTLFHDLTAAEVAAGKYLLESEDGAAQRIARHRHLDMLNARGWNAGRSIDVESTR